MSSIPPGARRVAMWLLRIAVAAALGWGALVLARDLDLARVGEVLGRADGLWVATAVALNLLQLLIRAVSWRVMLLPVALVPVRAMLRYHLFAFAASTLIPVRAGDFLRLYLLRRFEGVPVPASLAVTVLEKAYEAVTLVFFLVPLPWAVAALPAWVGEATLCLAAAGVFVLAGAWGLSRHAGARRPVLARLAQGAAAVQHPRLLAAGLGLLVVQWLADFAAAIVMLRAVGLDDVPWAASVLLVFIVNLAILIPVTPAHLGAFEVAAVFALALVGVEKEAAAGFALLFHAGQVLPLTLLGLGGLRLVAAARAEVREELARPGPAGQ